jgi:hypothetical protein
MPVLEDDASNWPKLLIMSVREGNIKRRVGNPFDTQGGTGK